MLYATLIAHSKHIDVLNDLKDQLNQEKKYFNTMQELSHDIMFKVDVKNKLLIHEPLEAEKFGISPVIHDFPESIVNKNILHPDDEAKCIIFTQSMMRGEANTHRMRIRRIHPITKAISFEWFELDTKPFKDEKGEVVEIIGKLTNIQDIISLELKASRDDLTGAYNKFSFREHVIEFFDDESRKTNNNLHALLFVDLDNFKYVNDTFGHSFGDYLLKSVAERLQNSIRTDDFLGRVGGDEFVILIKNVPSIDVIKLKLDTIFEKLRDPFIQKNISHKMSISIGVALYPKNSTNYDELYNLADSALYYSKNNGKNLSTFYDELDY